MNKPSDDIINSVAPPHEIDGLKISDGTAVRNVAHAEQLDTLRLPRGGDYEATLVAAKKFYDGGSGGVAGHYAMLFVEFRATGSRWRTAGVKIRAEEAGRVARHMLEGKPSKPTRAEPDRVGGKTEATADSELRGAQISKGGPYQLFVRHKNRADDWVRTRGVEILESEKAAVAAMLKQLSAALKEST